MGTIRFSGIAVLFLVVCISVYAGSEQESGKKLQELQEKLGNVEKELQAVDKQIESKIKEYQKFQHDIVYTNGVPAEIYKDIKALEKQLVEKRKALDEATMKVPGAREMVNDRKVLYKRKNDLIERLELLNNEIKSVSLRVTRD